MTVEWTGPDKEKLAALERLVGLQATVIDKLSEYAANTLAHMYALEQLLEERGVVTRAAVQARSQAMDLDSTAEIELDPNYEEFRRARDEIHRRLQEEDESPPA